MGIPLSMVGVEEGREFCFRGDLYSQESTFPLVFSAAVRICSHSSYLLSFIDIFA